MKISVKMDGLDALQAKLRGLADNKIKVAAVAALNDAAYLASQAVKKEIERVFDRPTPWVRRSVVYFKAGLSGRSVRLPGVYDIYGKPQKTTLSADRMDARIDLSGNAVSFENKQGVTPDQALAAQISGGPRRLKRHEVALQRIGVLPAGYFIVPGQAAQLDQYGGMNPGQINQILSFFAAFGQQGYTANMTAETKAKRAKGTKNKSGFEYFVVQDGAKRTWSRANGKQGSHKMQPGIYIRRYLGGSSMIQPVMIFVRNIHYKKRLDFYGIAERVALKEFNRAFPMYLEKLLKERGL